MKTFIPKDTKALIFDMDGTLIDSQGAHLKSWQQVMQDEQKKLTSEQYDTLSGKTSAGFTHALNEMHGTQMSADDAVIRKDTYYLQMLHEVSVYEKTMAVVREFFEKLPIALGTNENRAMTMLTLEALDIKKYFTVIVTSDDVEHPKPAPDLFLKCANDMGVNAKYCHVFEDSPVGIQAAKSAGMSVTDVSNLL